MDEKIAPQVERVSSSEENGNFDRSWRDEKWGEQRLSVAAQDTSNEEKEMTIR